MLSPASYSSLAIALHTFFNNPTISSYTYTWRRQFTESILLSLNEMYPKRVSLHHLMELKPQHVLHLEEDASLPVLYMSVFLIDE